MADYYVSTDDGRTHLIEDVTATPTIVVNDNVATTVYDGVYRDVLPFPNTGATAANFPFGPGWVSIPSYSGGATVTTYTPFEDDLVTNTAPRYLQVKKSFWQFVTAGGNYFFPMERVIGMSNTLPTY